MCVYCYIYCLASVVQQSQKHSKTLQTRSWIPVFSTSAIYWCRTAQRTSWWSPKVSTHTTAANESCLPEDHAVCVRRLSAAAAAVIPKSVFWPIFYFVRGAQHSYKYLRIHIKSEAEIRCVYCYTYCLASGVQQSQKKLRPLEASLLIGIKVLILWTLLIGIKVLILWTLLIGTKV